MSAGVMFALFCQGKKNPLMAGPVFKFQFK